MDFRIFYNQTAGSYDLRHNNPSTNYLRRKELGLIRRFSRGRILDIGCGTGFHLRLVKNATGIDISEGMLKIARKGSDVRRACAEKLPFPDNSFDTIFCFFSVLNMCNYRKAVKEMARVLKSGGLVLLSLSSIHDKGEFGIMKRKIRLKKLFTRKELFDVFGSNGFKPGHFDSVFILQKPRWGDFKPFTLKERARLWVERLCKKENGRIYLAAFRWLS